MYGAHNLKKKIAITDTSVECPVLGCPEYGVLSANVRSKKYFDLSRSVGYRPWNVNRAGGSKLHYLMQN
jgi:hypothetical protein